MELITIDQARQHLRTDSDADDQWIALWITIVSASVLSWLKDEWRAFEPVRYFNGDIMRDSNGDPIAQVDSNGPVVKRSVQGAVLLELAQQYRFRDGSGAAAVPSDWGHGYVLGAGATSMLVGLRKPTVT